jgi:hypothetical protein
MIFKKSNSRGLDRICCMRDACFQPRLRLATSTSLLQFPSNLSEPSKSDMMYRTSLKRFSDSLAAVSMRSDGRGLSNQLNLTVIALLTSSATDHRPTPSLGGVVGYRKLSWDRCA